MTNNKIKSKGKNGKIPKIIHYCWFGGNPLPDDVKKYIESWKKFCPDYKIIEWNESNFDLNMNTYIKEAYECKKWAFVSDYARLYALYNEGGIYLDTDVEVLKSFDDLLNLHAFCCFEHPQKISTAVMACEKKMKIFKEILDFYENRHFILENDNLDLTTNVETITKILLKHNLKQNGNYQVLNDLTIFPSEYFSPKNFETFKITTTKNTYAIHHFSGSWLPKSSKAVLHINIFFRNLFGIKVGEKVSNIILLPYRFFSKIKQVGFKNTIKHIINKLKNKKED